MQTEAGTEASTGPRLLCLHGFTGSPQAWQETLDLLPGEPDAWCPWLLGHGPGAGPDPDADSGLETGSDDQAEPASTKGSEHGPVTPATEQGFREEVQRLWRGLENRKWRRDVLLVGYSMGGRLALGLLAEAASQGDERFAAAVLIGASSGLREKEQREQRRCADEVLARQLEDEGLEAFLAGWEQRPMFADQAQLCPSRQARQHQWRRQHLARGLARSLRSVGLGSMPCLWQSLHEMQWPVTLIVGERDDKFRRIAEAMARRLPRSRVIIAPGSGHNVVLSRPQLVAAAIRQELPT